MRNISADHAWIADCLAPYPDRLTRWLVLHRRTCGCVILARDPGRRPAYRASRAWFYRQLEQPQTEAGWVRLVRVQPSTEDRVCV